MAYKSAIALLLVAASLIGAAQASQFLTKMELSVKSLDGVSELDNSDGTSVVVTILNSTGGVVVSRNASAGVYLPGMTITMQGEKFNLDYATDYVYRIETPQGTFDYGFTTPEEPGGGGVELHTGQTSCYDGDSTETCPVAGYPSQDAELDGTAKSYTCDANVCTDDHTGIMWQKGHNGATVTWQAALQYCDTLSLGGYDDWHLPNVLEMTTLVDYGRSDFKNPALTWGYDYFWTSTSHPSWPGGAYDAYFAYGSIGGYGKSSGHYVMARCARSAG